MLEKISAVRSVVKPTDNADWFTLYRKAKAMLSKPAFETGQLSFFHSLACRPSQATAQRLHKQPGFLGLAQPARSALRGFSKPKRCPTEHKTTESLPFSMMETERFNVQKGYENQRV